MWKHRTWKPFPCLGSAKTNQTTFKLLVKISLTIFLIFLFQYFLIFAFTLQQVFSVCSTVRWLPSYSFRFIKLYIARKEQITRKHTVSVFGLGSAPTQKNKTRNCQKTLLTERMSKIPLKKLFFSKYVPTYYDIPQPVTG